ncbi:hypothetical protein HanIR_Chr01g0051081 [Helianthus annuus]|nr:hypothetical protein HanIR_Chr01g0051081 [Helianthus annuus]
MKLHIDHHSFGQAKIFRTNAVSDEEKLFRITQAISQQVEAHFSSRLTFQFSSTCSLRTTSFWCHPQQQIQQKD